MIHTRRSIVSTTILAALAGLAFSTPASAWKFEEFMNAEGDRSTGIVQGARNEPGIEFAFGCQTDRWRQVALIPEGADPLRLASDGKVSIGFEPDRLSPDGTWKVRKIDGGVLYFAPSPTSLMGRLYAAEKKDPSSVLYVRVHPAKKSPVILQFPVAGLREAMAEHLWKTCKLDIYFGAPD